MNLLFRAKHVTRGDSYEKAGLSLSIVLNSIKSAWNKFEADHVVFCLDGKSWRKDVYPEYKANRAVNKLGMSSRELEEEKVFFEIANDFLNFVDQRTRCTVLKHSKCEADDFIASWIQKYSNNGVNKFVIVSSDSDFVQLLAPNVSIYDGVNKKVYTADGVFDDKLKPLYDKQGILVEPVNPEFALFEKCIRGDSSDNIASAYPGVRTKGSAKKAGIEEAFADRHSQGYIWVNFMKHKWEDIYGVEHTVEEDFKRNRDLIDLTRQPDDIKSSLNETIEKTLAEEKDVKQLGIHFLKFCGKHELKKISEQAESFVKILSSGYPKQ